LKHWEPLAQKQSLIPERECPMEILLKFFHHIQILILPVHVHVFQCASAAHLLQIEQNIYNSQKSLKVKLQIKTNYKFHAQ